MFLGWRIKVCKDSGDSFLLVWLNGRAFDEGCTLCMTVLTVSWEQVKVELAK